MEGATWQGTLGGLYLLTAAPTDSQQESRPLALQLQKDESANNLKELGSRSDPSRASDETTANTWIATLRNSAIGSAWSTDLQKLR